MLENPTRDDMPEDNMDVPRWKFWKRRRYIVTLMALFGFFNVFALRVNVSVAIVAMTSTSSRTLENGTVVEDCEQLHRDLNNVVRWTADNGMVVNGVKSQVVSFTKRKSTPIFNYCVDGVKYFTEITELPEFNWDSKLQGLVLGSYFYGYITTQILGGWLAARVGGNKLFGLGIAVTSLLTLLTPLLVRVSVYWFIAIRVIEGIFEGVSYPSMHDVWAHWAPPLERSRLATFAYSGSYIGTVVVMPISGVLAQNVGWPAVFYVFGVVGLVWFAAWWVLVKRGPQYDRHIDPRELKYLQDALPVVPKNVVHPWKKFFASGPVWAVIVANFSENWGFYTLLTQLPIFMKDTLEFDIQEAGFLSALPYVVVAATMQVAGHIADWFLSRKILNTTQVRKLFCCSAFLCQSLFMLLAAFLLTPAGAVTCLTLAVGLGAFAMSGFFVNHLDIAPQHASVLLGIGNTFGTMPGIISPTISGYIVQHKTTSEWQIVFYISSAIYLIGSIFYGIFASGEVQSWAKAQQSDEAVNRNSLDGHSNKAPET